MGNWSTSYVWIFVEFTFVTVSWTHGRHHVSPASYDRCIGKCFEASDRCQFGLNRFMQNEFKFNRSEPYQTDCVFRPFLFIACRFNKLTKIQSWATSSSDREKEMGRQLKTLHRQHLQLVCKYLGSDLWDSRSTSIIFWGLANLNFWVDRNWQEGFRTNPVLRSLTQLQMRRTTRSFS